LCLSPWATLNPLIVAIAILSAAYLAYVTAYIAITNDDKACEHVCPLGMVCLYANRDLNGGGFGPLVGPRRRLAQDDKVGLDQATRCHSFPAPSIGDQYHWRQQSSGVANGAMCRFSFGGAYNSTDMANTDHEHGKHSAKPLVFRECRCSLLALSRQAKFNSQY
jgi:hypothetical protein